MTTITEPDIWLGVEIRHLAALEAVASEGSFGRAATGSGYTQSAVSQQIATLERIVGEKLIERPGGPRAVSLTEAGELLLRHAEAIVHRLDAARADIAALRAGETGSLRVGTYQSVGRPHRPRSDAAVPQRLAGHRARAVGAVDRSGAVRGRRERRPRSGFLQPPVPGRPVRGGRADERAVRAPRSRRPSRGPARRGVARRSRRPDADRLEHLLERRDGRERPAKSRGSRSNTAFAPTTTARCRVSSRRDSALR